MCESTEPEKRIMANTNHRNKQEVVETPRGRNGMIYEFSVLTLASRIDVGPTFINFGFFSRPYGLIREYIKVI